MQSVEWSLPDFVGKYHLNRMTTGTPIPGTALRVDREHGEVINERNTLLQQKIDNIEARRSLRAKGRVRQAAVSARVEIEATVGRRLAEGEQLQHLLLR